MLIQGHGFAICDDERPAFHWSIAMLYTIAVILLILWLLGAVGTFAVGQAIHVLLIVAIVLFVLGLMRGRRSAL